MLPPRFSRLLFILSIWTGGCRGPEVSTAAATLCQLSLGSSGLVLATPSGLGTAEDVPAHGGYSAFHGTPVALGISTTVSGANPDNRTVWVEGDVHGGMSDQGPFIGDAGQYLTGYYFFVTHDARSFLYTGGGYFWRDGTWLRNDANYRGGIAEDAFLAQVRDIQDAGKCSYSGGTDAGVQSADAGDGG